MPALVLLAAVALLADGCRRRAARGLVDVVRAAGRDTVGRCRRRIMRGGVLADEPLAAELRHAGGLAGHVVGRGRALVLALGLALIFDTLLDRGGLGLGALRLLALALRLRLDALLLEDGEALFGLVELGLLGERLLGRLLARRRARAALRAASARSRRGPFASRAMMRSIWVSTVNAPFSPEGKTLSDM